MIQQLIDSAIADGSNYVWIPQGTYVLDKGVVVGNKDFSFLNSIYIEAAPGSRFIVPKHSFGIAFQRCKGFRFKGVTLEGENLLWRYSLEDVLFNDSMDWVNGCRDSHVSPHAGILVDPFHESVQDRYEGFDDWYQNTYKAGSTDGILDDVRARYFIDGIAIQPSGISGNGDCISINNTWVDYSKYGISTGNHQNRSILVNNLKCWGNTHTLFNMRYTGGGVGCPMEVDGLNVAGGVKFLTAMHSFTNYNALTIRRAHTELLTSLGGCDTPHGRLVISDSWVNLTPIGKPIFTGSELIMDNSTLTNYGHTPEIMEIEAYHASFNNTNLDELPKMANKLVKGKLSIRGYNRQGFIVSDNETFFVNSDSNDSTKSYVVAQDASCVISYNYKPNEYLKFEPMDGYYDNGYLRRFLPNLCSGYVKKGSNVITDVDLADPWRWRQFETGIQLVGECFEKGTLIEGYDFDNKTVTISKPAIKSGTTGINGAKFTKINANN